MDINIITLFPTMFDCLKYSIPLRAQSKGQLQLNFWNPRDYTQNKQGKVDDSPYGGGPGMVMQYQPLRDTIEAIKAHAPRAKVLYLSAQGQSFNQQAANDFAKASQLILLCGRYEGIDQRVIDYLVDEEWSVGEVVLSGGELAAMLIIDAVSRLLPNVLGNEDSAKQDSFYHGLLDYPHYSRPACIDDHPVPKVLLSGDHQAITKWRLQQALGNTWQKRPDLLERRVLDQAEFVLLQEYQRLNREKTHE